MTWDKKNIPSLFTVLNLFCGFLSIILSIEGNLLAAPWLIILAVLCDGMDGKLARLIHTETHLGFELDSLADAVSFGAAPAVLLYQRAFSHFHVFGFFMVFLYLMAGIYRLARFNVIQQGDRSQGYIGLPIPVAAMNLAAWQLFDIQFRLGNPVIPPVMMCLFLSLVMVSGIRYDWPKLNFHGSALQKTQSVLLIAGVILMAVFPGAVLFPILLLYILHGIGRGVAAWIRGDISAEDLIHPVKTV